MRANPRIGKTFHSPMSPLFARGRADVTGQFRPRMASGPAATGFWPHETVLSEAIHMVERRDLWHPIVDLAVRRVGRNRRAGQSLLSHPRRQDRSDPAFRAALGDL